jgi:hypothetical protein
MRVPGLVVLFALAGCAGTPTEWTRTDTSASQRATDEKQCADIAYQQALDESMASHNLYPPYTGTGFGWGPPFHSVRSPSYFDRGPREYEFRDYCMRQRGYVLTPIRQAAAR